MPSATNQERYGVMFRNFVLSSRKKHTTNGRGPVNICDSKPAGSQLWVEVQPIINGCCNIIQPLLSIVGVKENDRSPFYCIFDTIAELRDELIKYCPNTFEYSDVTGNVINENIMFVVDPIKPEK